MSTTTNLADFGFREIKLARDLLDAWINSGLPSDFGTEGVTVMMNQSSRLLPTNQHRQTESLGECGDCAGICCYSIKTA